MKDEADMVVEHFERSHSGRPWLYQMLPDDLTAFEGLNRYVPASVFVKDLASLYHHLLQGFEDGFPDPYFEHQKMLGRGLAGWAEVHDRPGDWPWYEPEFDRFWPEVPTSDEQAATQSEARS